MGKIKKTLKKKVNPEKSNKMIYAVTIGLVIIFGGLLLLLVDFDDPKDARESIDSALKYLKKTSGIISVTYLPEEKKVIIVYNSTADNKNKYEDYQTMARYAAIRLSNIIKKEPLAIILAEDKESNELFRIDINQNKDK